ncbi:MAG: CpsD/CapB family tyrosine-protein kinase, partial [Deinococcales bacterium]
EPLAVASPPTDAVGPRVVFRTFVALVLGLFGAYGWLFTRWSLDPHVRGRDDLGVLGAGPVLGEFPRRARQERTLSAEAANFLRASVLVASRYRSPLVVAVTSAESGAERAGVAWSLAESFARAGDRVLLVDGDLRGPGVTATLGGSSREAPTLANHLEEPHLDLPPTPVGVDARTSFDFIPSAGASASPVELLGRGLADKLEAWRHDYDLIVVDAPPVLRYADALTIAPLCTGLVLCAGVGHSRRDRVRDGVTRPARGGRERCRAPGGAGTAQRFATPTAGSAGDDQCAHQHQAVALRRARAVRATPDGQARPAHAVDASPAPAVDAGRGRGRHDGRVGG